MVKRATDLRFDLYFTAQDIKSLLLDEESRKRVLAYFKPLNLLKVYFEFAHLDHQISDKEIKPVIASFRKAGIVPAGALISFKNSRPLCYNNPDHEKGLATQARRLAALFDEIIIDDWLFTVCNCSACVKARGDRSWADYRSALLPKKTKTLVIDAAKSVNPSINIIIKFPNWWESYHHNGYNLKAQLKQFETYCQGIETRGLATHLQHFPVYIGYFLQRWIEKIAPQKRVSCWFDNWDMATQSNEYIAQLYQGILGGSREMVVWSGGTHYTTNPWSCVYPDLIRHIPKLSKLAGIVPTSKPTGIDTYIPYESDGEYNITGYLGMIGLPLNPTPVFPTKLTCCIFTLHSAKDIRLVEKLLARLESGRDVFMTWNLYERLRNTDLGNALQIIDSDGTVTPHELKAWDRSKPKFSLCREKNVEQISFRRIRITTWPYANFAAGVLDDGDYSILLCGRYLNGNVYVLNVPEDQSNLLKLPAFVLNAVRRAFSPQLHYALEAPANVACYMYEPDTIVLYNMNESPSNVSLTFDSHFSGTRWAETFSRIKLDLQHEGDNTLVSLKIPVYGIAVLQKTC